MPDSYGMAFGKSLANSAGSGLVSGGINQLFGSLTAKRDYKYWKKRVDYENKLQKEWFNMANEYNSPAQQVARLKDAGLSPALMFGGSGAGASVGASSADMPSAPSGGGASSSSLNPSYDALASSVIKLNSAKAREAESNSDKTDAERDYQNWMNNILAPLLAEGKSLENTGKKYQNAIDLINASYLEIEKLSDLGEQQIRIGEMLATIDKLKSDKELNDRERQQLDVIAQEIRSRIKVNESEAKLNDSKTRFTDMSTSQVEANILSVLRDLDLKDLDIAKTARQVMRMYRNMPATDDTSLFNTGGWLVNSFISAVTGNLTSDEDASQFLRKRGEVEKKLRKKFGLDE